MNTDANEFLPMIRQKRGASNFLAGIIKAISGNLDHEDAERYDVPIEFFIKNKRLNYQN